MILWCDADNLQTQKLTLADHQLLYSYLVSRFDQKRFYAVLPPYFYLTSTTSAAALHLAIESSGQSL